MRKGRPKASKSKQKYYSQSKNNKNNNKQPNKINKQTINKHKQYNQEQDQQYQEANNIKQQKQNKQTNRQMDKNSKRTNSSKSKTKIGSKQVKKVDRVNNFSPRVTRSSQKKSNKNQKSSKNKRDKSLQKGNKNKSKQKNKNNQKMKNISNNKKQTTYQRKKQKIQTDNKYVTKQKKKKNLNSQSKQIKSNSSRSIIQNQRSGYFIRSVRNIKSQTKSMYVDSQQVELANFIMNDKKKYGNNIILKSDLKGKNRKITNRKSSNKKTSIKLNASQQSVNKKGRRSKENKFKQESYQDYQQIPVKQLTPIIERKDETSKFYSNNYQQNSYTNNNQDNYKNNDDNDKNEDDNDNDEQYFGYEQNNRNENVQRQLNQSMRKIQQKINRNKYIKQKNNNKNKIKKNKPKMADKKYLSFAHQLVDMMFNAENYQLIDQFPKAKYLQSKKYIAQLYSSNNKEDIIIVPDYRQLFDYTYQYEQILMKKQDIIRRMQNKQIVPILMPHHLKQQQQSQQSLTQIIDYEQQKNKQKPILSLQYDSDDLYSDTSSVLFEQIRFKQDMVPYYEKGANILFNELIYKPFQQQSLYSLKRFNNNQTLQFYTLDRHYYRAMDEFNLYFSHCIQIDNQYGKVLETCYSYVFPQLNDIYFLNINSQQQEDDKQHQQDQSINIQNQQVDQQEFENYDQSLEDSRYWNQKQRDQNIKKKQLKLLKIADQEYQIMKFSDLEKWFVPFFQQLPKYAKKALNTPYPNQAQGQPQTLWHHLHLSRINNLSTDNSNENSQLNNTGQYSNANSIFAKIGAKFKQKQPIYKDKYIIRKQHKPQKRDFMISNELSNISRTKSMGKYSTEDKSESFWGQDIDI